MPIYKEIITREEKNSVLLYSLYTLYSSAVPTSSSSPSSPIVPFEASVNTGPNIAPLSVEATNLCGGCMKRAR
jgi:hypothetical protein